MGKRSAYTLFEVVLVMAVLVVVGAVSVPLLRPMLSSNNLQAASDVVRSRWTEMRTRAVSDGRAYRFSIQENTGKFRIAPDDDDTSAHQGGARPWVIEETLPGGVLFVTGNGGGRGAQSHGGSGMWTPLVTFLPDGTSREDVQVSFGQTGSGSLTLKLRGATGSITATEEGHRS